MISASTIDTEYRPLQQLPLRRAGTESSTQLCPQCDAKLNVIRASRRQVIACSECGQCLDASVDFALTDWSGSAMAWPFKHKCMSGWTEILFAFAIGAVGYISWLPAYGRVAASVVAAGVFLEGLGRIKRALDQRKFRDPLTFGAPSDAAGLGPLKAAFVTRNSIIDSVVIGCIVIALGCGLAWIAEFMAVENGAVDGNTVKGIFCLVLLPCVMLYTIYKAIRLKWDRRLIYVYQNGFYYDVRGEGISIPWADVLSLTAVHLGDAIDEDAIDFEFRVKHKKLRITRGQFPQIQSIWERLLQEAEREIRQRRIQIHTRIQGKPGHGY